MPNLGLVLDLSHTGFAAVLSVDAEKVLASEVRHGGTRHDDLGDWLEGLLKQGRALVPELVGSASNADMRPLADESRPTANSIWDDIAWICVGLGPGSFTGIRIAMAFAQGVALPGKIPLYGFTSFEALFLSFPGTVPELVGSASDADMRPLADESRPVAAIAANSGRFYLARGLDDPGVLTGAEEYAQAARDHAVLTPDDHWDYAAIAKYARAFDGGRGRDAHKPYYLQLSAAEDKAAADKAAQG